MKMTEIDVLWDGHGLQMKFSVIQKYFVIYDRVK